jgi:cytochrome c oxidase subunit 2
LVTLIECLADVRPRILLALGGWCVALSAVAGPALAGNGGFAPVPPESPNAEGITTTWWFITAFILLIFVLVEGLLVLFVLRYRRRRRSRDEDGVQIHGSTRLELMWTAGPVLVLFAIAVFVAVKLPGIADTPSSAAGAPLRVEVVGQQFFWQFRYPNEVVAIDRLRAPAGVPVELVVTAPDWDVVHSWWVPALGGKIDAIPGHVNTTWFQVARPGVYKGRCAELCGLYHAKMLDEVEVMPADAFAAWLEEQASAQQAADPELGRAEWEGVCAKCHGMDAEGGYGPAIPPDTLVDDRAIARVVRAGRALPGRPVMPPVGRDWTDNQIESLNAYLEERFGNQG